VDVPGPRAAAFVSSGVYGFVMSCFIFLILFVVSFIFCFNIVNGFLDTGGGAGC